MAACLAHCLPKNEELLYTQLQIIDKSLIIDKLKIDTFSRVQKKKKIKIDNKTKNNRQKNRFTGQPKKVS